MNCWINQSKSIPVQKKGLKQILPVAVTKFIEKMASPGKDNSGDDLYDYDYSIDLNSGGSAPSTSFGGFKPTAQGGRLMTGAQGRMMTGQVPGSRMGTSSGVGSGDLRPMTSVSGAGYSVR